MAIVPLFIDELAEEAFYVFRVVREPRRPPAHILLLTMRVGATILHFEKIFDVDSSEKLELIAKYR